MKFCLSSGLPPRLAKRKRKTIKSDGILEKTVKTNFLVCYQKKCLSRELEFEI
jgi:hypothetical protein